MYLYVGKVRVGPLSGYLWLLGNRLYLKLSWRPSDTYFLGNLSDPLTLAARLKRLIPRPVDVRRAAVQLARALAAALYVARRCRDSPRWKIRVFFRCVEGSGSVAGFKVAAGRSIYEVEGLILGSCVVEGVGGFLRAPVDGASVLGVGYLVPAVEGGRVLCGFDLQFHVWRAPGAQPGGGGGGA